MPPCLLECCMVQRDIADMLNFFFADVGEQVFCFTEQVFCFFLGILYDFVALGFCRVYSEVFISEFIKQASELIYIGLNLIAEPAAGIAAFIGGEKYGCNGSKHCTG